MLFVALPSTEDYSVRIDNPAVHFVRPIAHVSKMIRQFFSSLQGDALGKYRNVALEMVKSSHGAPQRYIVAFS